MLDPDLNPVRIISNVRSPWAVCITPPNAQGQQFLFSADAGGKIYKIDLEGKLLGWFGTLGKRVGQFYWVHQMHCVSENELYHRRSAELARAAHHDEGRSETLDALRVGAEVSLQAASAAIAALAIRTCRSVVGSNGSPAAFTSIRHRVVGELL